MSKPQSGNGTNKLAFGSMDFKSSRNGLPAGNDSSKPKTSRKVLPAEYNSSNNSLSLGSIRSGIVAPLKSVQDSGIKIAAHTQRVAPGPQTVGFMSGPESRMASSRGDNLQPYSEFGPYHGIPNLEEQRFKMTADGTLRHLFASQNPAPARRSTPSEEEINNRLIRMGLHANTGTADILETTRSQLRMNANRPVQGAQSTDKPAQDSTNMFLQNKGLIPSPASSNPNSDSRWSGYQSSIADQELGAEWTAGRPDFSYRKFPATGQIDPYIPEQAEKIPSSIKNDTRNQQWNGQHYNTPTLGLGIDIRGYPLTPSSTGLSNSEGFSPNKNGEMSSLVGLHQNNRVLPSSSSFRPGSSPEFNDEATESMRTIQALQKRILEYKNQAYLNRGYFENACNTAMRQITIRNAEIASLKRQLRQEGLKPYNEITRSNDQYFEHELAMMFRTICCWSKRHYKFPTTEKILGELQSGVAEVCEDPKNESFLMSSNSTKYLVVIAMASKFLVEKIFSPDFLNSISQEMVKHIENGGRTGNVVAEVIEMYTRDAHFDDKVYGIHQRAAKQLASEFLDLIQPLMSRPRDNPHYDQTRKQFVPIAQQAARILMATAARNAMVQFSVFHFGDKFQGEMMKEVTADTLGLEVATRSTDPVWHELRGSVIRLCMLPHCKVIFLEDNGSTREIIAYKANVLLC